MLMLTGCSSVDELLQRFTTSPSDVLTAGVPIDVAGTRCMQVGTVMLADGTLSPLGITSDGNVVVMV